MKKDLFISLGVMILLTLIVGYTAYSLTARWSDLPDVVTRNVTKEVLWKEISTSIELQQKTLSIYIFKTF